MIDITVSPDNCIVYIDGKTFALPKEVVKLIEEIIDKAKYSGEHISLSQLQVSYDKKFLYE